MSQDETEMELIKADLKKKKRLRMRLNGKKGVYGKKEHIQV